MNSSSSVLEYINELLVKLHHSLITDEIDNLCVVLNLLYRVRHDKPFIVKEKDNFLFDENYSFVSDNLDDEEDPVLCSLNDFYKKDEIFSLIINTYRNLCRINHEDFLKVYTEAVDDALNRHLPRLRSHINYQSIELTRLVCSLITARGIKSVYNPYAQIASYSLGLKDIDYYGQDISPQIRMIGRIRMDAHQKDVSRYFLGDVIYQWDNHGAECVVCTPPYGRIDRIHEYKNMDNVEFVIDRFINSDSTYAYIVSSPSICYNFRSHKLRAYITDKNYLETVVSLPPNLFSGTGIASYLIILNKKKQNNNTLYIDASDLATKKARNAILEDGLVLDLVSFPSYEDKRIKIVYAEQIRERDYDWNPNSYFQLSEDQIPPGFIARQIGDVAQFVHRKKGVQGDNGHVVTIKDLNNNSLNFTREVSSFPTTDKTNYYYYIKEPVILVSSLNKLRPIYCKASSENPIYIDTNVLAFRITNSWIDPSYLCLALSKIEMSAGRSTMRFDARLLELTHIPLPIELSPVGLEEQQRIYQEAADTFNRSKIKELGLQKTIDKIKADYMNEVRMRKHDMKTPMTQMRSTFVLLKELAKNAPQEISEKLNVYINRQETALKNLTEIVRHIADEEKFADPEPVNIEEILNKEVTKGNNYIAEYHRDEEAFTLAEINQPVVNIGRADFIRMVQNIIGNAIKHGFVDSHDNYKLNINLTIDDQFYVIEFTNNGSPLPEGMDKEHYGIKGVKGKDSEGDGTGGYVVKSICQHYNGDYDVFSNEVAGEILTTVIVKLPIYLENEQV